MADSLVRTETVSIHSGTVAVPAYVAAPSRAGTFPGVVVLQEVFGVNSHIREVTERLARAGYVAIAPHIYHRQVANFEVGYSPEDLALGRKYKQGTHAEELLLDVNGAIDWLLAQPQVVQGGIGCIGFCFGGHVAYLAATQPRVRATACFYGAGLTTFTPGGGAPTLSRTGDITGTVYGFFGTEDPLIPLPEVDQIEVALTQQGVDHRICRYEDATHGFFCDQRSSYNATVAQAAWDQVLSLFQPLQQPATV